MFDFLNKLSHQHNKSPPPEQRPKPLPIQQKNKQVSEQNENISQSQVKQPRIKHLSLSASLQLGQTCELDPEVMKILQQIRDESQKRFSSETMLQMTNQERSKVQRKVYLREMSTNFDEYLQQILVQSSSPNRFTRFGVAEMVDHASNAVFQDILYTDKYQISKKSAISKDEIKFIQKQMSQIKNNETNIKQKVGELKLQLRNEAQKISNRSLQIIQKNQFSINHPKTKQVQEFLRNIQNERQQRKRKQQQKRQKHKQQVILRQKMMQQMRQKAKSERHQRMVEQFSVKRRVKQMQSLQAEKKNEDFQQWMKVYKKKVPLYKQKQKEFQQNFVRNQEQQRFQKLMRRKQRYAPIQFQDIEDHQQRYLEYKRDFGVGHQAQKKLKAQQQKRRKQQLQKLHKGQFRYFILQEMVQRQQQKDPKQALIQKKIRQLAYSQNVKDYHRPAVDPVKRHQMQSILSSSSKKKRFSGPKRVSSMSLVESGELGGYDDQQIKDPKKQGERYRRYIKQYIKQKIEKGEIKKKQDTQSRISTIQPRPNYLHEMRSERESSTAAKKADTIDHEIRSIKQKQDVSALMAIVSQHDSKAQRMQQKIKLSVHKPQQQAALQDNYLFSIKAKMQLLKHYN